MNGINYGLLILHLPLMFNQLVLPVELCSLIKLLCLTIDLAPCQVQCIHHSANEGNGEYMMNTPEIDWHEPGFVVSLLRANGVGIARH